MQGFISVDGHEGWFADARRIIAVTETGAGLPLPTIAPASASFSFTGIPRAEIAREVVANAKRLLTAELGVTFDWRYHQNGSSRYRLYEAMLPSGMVLSLVVRAEHFDGIDEDAPVLEVVAA
jgi:hypothetical protein